MRASGASLAQVGWAVRARRHPARDRDVPRRRVRRAACRAARADGPRARRWATRRGVVAQQFESGFWFKQDLTFVNIRTVLADLTLVGVRIYEFDRDLRLTAVRTAESGRFAGDGRWQLEQREGHRVRRATRRRCRTAPTLDVGDGAAAVDPDRLPGRARAARADDAVRQHPRARRQRAEDVALRDRVLEQDLLSGRRAGR